MVFMCQYGIFLGQGLACRNTVVETGSDCFADDELYNANDQRHTQEHYFGKIIRIVLCQHKIDGLAAHYGQRAGPQVKGKNMLPYKPGMGSGGKLAYTPGAGQRQYK